jgi:hypothetical protein
MVVAITAVPDHDAFDVEEVSADWAAVELLVIPRLVR